MTVETTQGTVTVTIDGFEIRVPKGTLVIRAAELLGIQIPRFCDHPLLDPIGACRQCLVDVEGQRKPLASCTTACTEGMVVHTQLTSAVADKAQRGVMELLLINHPLDCPMCDKGGECTLQNQAMSSGQGETRFTEDKRTFDKPVPISTQVLLDRERCISCTRCVRTSEEIAGDAFIDFIDRGPSQFIGTAEGKPFNSYFSVNTVQVCPVGALTGAAYRFRSRPFDLVSVPSVCEHCASGCRQRTDVRRGRVARRLAGDDPAVNAEWNCDKGRWAFTYATQPDRLTTPLIRDEAGVLVPASWPHALAVAAAGLVAARDADPAAEPAHGAGVLTGGRLTLEDAYAYAKFARVALDTNDIDMRARPHSAEEEQFLAACVAGRGIGVSYADLEQAPAVLLAGFEPEDESPIVFLRLRKAVRRRGQQVFSVAALASPGLAKLSGELLATVPGDEASMLTVLAGGTTPPDPPAPGGTHPPRPPLGGTGPPASPDHLAWKGLDVGSPFDHPRSGILYVARHLPPPGRDQLPEAYLTELEELIGAAGGRTLGLFSSMRAAKEAAGALRERISQPLFCQGDDLTAQLVRQFAEDEPTCLFGTLSLWQGVDVPGNSLQLVVIDRIPFPRPDDPLASARQRAVAAHGGNGFMTVAASHAALLLAQGAGRLLRTMTDRGVVAVLDPRLVTARYGDFLRASLPPFWTTTDPSLVRAALRRLAAASSAASSADAAAQA